MLDWFSIQWFSFNQFRAYTWDEPYYLYGIIAIPILFWLRVGLHSQAFQKLNISVISEDIVASSTAWLRWLYPISIFLSMACILIALARPQIINNLIEKDAEVIDIVLALDVSDSMQEKDLKPNRLSAAKSVAKNFVMGRLQDRIGLVVFAGEAFTLCPLTDDYELLYGFIDDIKADLVQAAGTAIGSSLAVSINRLRESKAKSRVIILLSDGENTDDHLDPETAAKLAQAFGIKVYTIAVGIPKTVITTTDSTGTYTQKLLDEGTLKQIAGITGGQFYRATDNNILQDVFSNINLLERVKVKNRKYQDIKDYYRVYLNWGIVFLLIALFLKVILVANVLED